MENLANVPWVRALKPQLFYLRWALKILRKTYLFRLKRMFYSKKITTYFACSLAFKILRKSRKFWMKVGYTNFIETKTVDWMKVLNNLKHPSLKNLRKYLKNHSFLVGRKTLKIHVLLAWWYVLQFLKDFKNLLCLN